MCFIALATDYDGTLAHHGRVDEQAIAVLEQFKASGRYLLMVTGRELPDLKGVFDRLELFDVVVAENGALLYFPKTQEERSVAAAPPIRTRECTVRTRCQTPVGREGHHRHMASQRSDSAGMHP
jgi:trehalose-6-phosphatase